MREQRYECDLCGKRGLTETLREQYATDDVHEVCEACRVTLNTRLSKIEVYLADIKVNIFKRFIGRLFAQRKRKREIRVIEHDRPVDEALSHLANKMDRLILKGTTMNIKPGDVVVFGEDSDAAVGKIVSIGYPLTVVDFNCGPPAACFTGGITRFATDEERAKFEKEGEPVGTDERAI